MEKKKENIVIFDNQGIALKVDVKNETVWLTQKQMEILFNVTHATISEHINNVFKEGELDKRTSVGISDKSSRGRTAKIYNLDVIISVGYRVKSKNGVIFRKWANKILKEYVLKGYSLNIKRLEYLEKTIKIIDIANRIDSELNSYEAREMLKIIGEYSKALSLLEKYDRKTLEKIGKNDDKRQIEYAKCIEIIDNQKIKEKSKLFGLTLNKSLGLETIIGSIYQTFNGQDVYASIEEKGANFLYLIVKNHAFVDGNKRIAAILFIYFLKFYGILYNKNEKIIDNNTLVALTILIAQSHPKEKEVIIDLIMNFLI